MCGSIFFTEYTTRVLIENPYSTTRLLALERNLLVGIPGSNQCPKGTVKLTYEECESKATTGFGAWIELGNQDDCPPGCFTYKNERFYNKGGNSSSSDQDASCTHQGAVICRINISDFKDMEFGRNRERFELLKRGQTSFENFKIMPPGSKRAEEKAVDKAEGKLEEKPHEKPEEKKAEEMVEKKAEEKPEDSEVKPEFEGQCPMGNVQLTYEECKTKTGQGEWRGSYRWGKLPAGCFTYKDELFYNKGGNGGTSFQDTRNQKQCKVICKSVKREETSDANPSDESMLKSLPSDIKKQLLRAMREIIDRTEQLEFEDLPSDKMRRLLQAMCEMMTITKVTASSLLTNLECQAGAQTAGTLQPSVQYGQAVQTEGILQPPMQYEQ